ncbi:MAG: beta galactosidase jelly roll domain-containing protein, partial [Bacteroidales bacterium]|nr:beta galactosidase jelly roll domain-containing protein [Bacteroidales bacterium]
MKRLLILVAILLASCSLASAQQSRNITNFDKDWEFSLGEEKKSWRKLDLPHDWSIEGENLESNPGAGKVGYFPSGTGWYRKTFDVKGYSRDKIYSIEFDGIYMNSTVWVNGTCLGTWPYGYSSFSYDLTPVLKAKGNVITVHVDNSKQPNSRWYTGSGIYRHVRLVAT